MSIQREKIGGRFAGTAGLVPHYDVLGLHGQLYQNADDEPEFETPDGAQRLIETSSGKGDDCCREFAVQNVKTGESVKVENPPEVFQPPLGVMRSHEDPKRVFLTTSPLRVVFIWNHLNSTEGDTTHALDLNTLKFVSLSANWAAPFPLPHEPAFLTYTEDRYRLIPGSEKLANSSYIDHWDAKLERVRPLRPGCCGAVCYGASMYCPAKSRRGLPIIW